LQEYYRNAGYIIKNNPVKAEDHTFENPGWAEHISRKLGLWMHVIGEQKELLKKRRFNN